MSSLFSPLTLRSVTFKNRIVVSPMCEYSSVDGFANDWHLVHLGSRAVGGAGAVIVEATAVTPGGRITPDDLGLWKDAQAEGLERIAHFINAQGSVPGIQLAHAGRKASRTSPWKGDKLLLVEQGGWPLVSASPLPFREGEPAPAALELNDIHRLTEAFAQAAERSLRAGFRVLEIHAAHGYLLHQFLSPLSNKRTDIYGGPLDNRTRLLREVVSAVRKVWPETLPLMVRISATDWDPEGWSPEDSVSLAKQLKGLGVDLIDCSSGGILPTIRIPLAPGYQVPLSQKVRQEGSVPTAAVGLITTAAQAQEILEQEQADLVFFARQLLRDPYFPLHAASELGVDLPWPPQYERAKPK